MNTRTKKRITIYKKNVKFVNNLIKEKKKKKKKAASLPKNIMKDHKIIMKYINKIKKDNNMFHQDDKHDKKITASKIWKLESKNKNIKLADNNNELRCIAQTSHYTRCKQSVKYIHKTLNKSDENIKKKKNAPFCVRHMNSLLHSVDNKSLKYGFYFENDNLK